MFIGDAVPVYQETVADAMGQELFYAARNGHLPVQERCPGWDLLKLQPAARLHMRIKAQLHPPLAGEIKLQAQTAGD